MDSRYYKKKYDPSNAEDAEELLNYLEELQSDDENYQQVDNADFLEFVLLPPADGNDSDEDDAASDGEVLPNIRHIGKGVLAQNMEVVTISKDGEKNVFEEKMVSSDSESDLESLADKQKRLKSKKKGGIKKVKRLERQWQQIDLVPRGGKIDNLRNEEPDLVQKMKNEEWKPIDIFKLFYNENIMNFICEQSKIYADQKGFHDFNLTVDNLYKYLAIILLSGYCPVTSRRMYWETRADTHNALVANSMSRNKFETIHRFIHFNDNSKIDKEDKVYKVRPLLNHINNICAESIQPLGKFFSLDEAMEPYYGRHSMKQFIRGKPIRFGFKFWCLATFDGYLIKFDVYQGAGDKVEGKTLGSSVTEKLCLNFLPQNSLVFLDNYFNSLPLLETLTENQLFCVGTIRSDRIEKAPVADLKKQKRGTSHSLQDSASNITLTRWHDNSQVTMATNLDDKTFTTTKGSCKRWSRQERSSIAVEQPSIISYYNKGMGGVDRFDQMRGLYRSRIRSKKWYWPIFRFLLNGSIVNMWYLYRYVEPNISMVEFLRRIVLAILSSSPNTSTSGPKPKKHSGVLEEIRYDGKDHLIDKQDTQRRCAKCGKCTKFKCLKCNIGLHPDGCFRIYHLK